MTGEELPPTFGDGRFLIQRQLGSGAMGVVYQALDQERNTPVALKTLKKLSPYRIYLFKNEFRALADLRHPNLVRLYELFREDDLWFFTMELLEGREFLEHFTLPGGEGGGRFPFEETKLRAAFGQLAKGIFALHSAGKIHRDIKPSNILVTTAERVVLLDFGLIADARPGVWRDTPRKVGTPFYMSPEQAAAGPADQRADWYSMGVILYQALTGTLPFTGTSQEIIEAKQRRDPEPPSARMPGIPEDLDELCMALLARDPKERPGAEEILTRLGAWGEERPASDLTSQALPAGGTSGQLFVGREEEQRTLRAAFEESRAGKPVTLFVYGESGLGKSALIRWFLEPLPEESGALVLSGRCYEQEQVRFKAFDGLIDALCQLLIKLRPEEVEKLLPEDAALLGRLFPVLRRVEKLSEEEPSGLEQLSPLERRSRAFTALRELLGRICAHRPLVLFIDDLQWADKDSLALLGALIRPPGAPPLFLVASVRGSFEEMTQPGGFLAELYEEGAEIRQILLQKLSPGESRALIRQLSGLSGGAAEALVREGDGHPLFLQELARYAVRARADTPGALLDEVLWGRVERLPAPARYLLELVAVAGAPLPQKTLIEAAHLVPSEYNRLVDMLRMEHLVQSLGLHDEDPIEPYHDRVREAVCHHLDEATLAHHHLRLAEALEAAGAEEEDPQALVRHFKAGGRPERAAKHAKRAASLANASLAFDQAAEFYQLALALGQENEEEARRLRLALGEALAHAGRGKEAAQAFLEAARGADDQTRLDCQRRAAEHLLGSGHLEHGLAVLQELLSSVGEALPQTPRQALLSLLWSRARLRVRGLGWKEKESAAQNLRDLLRLDIYHAISVGLGQIDTIRAADFQARGLLLALQVGERRRLARALATEAIFLGAQKRRHFARAKKLLAEADRIVQQEEDPYGQAFAAASRGICYYVSGEIKEAHKTLKEAERLYCEKAAGTAWELNNIRISRLYTTVRIMGLLGEERPYFESHLKDAEQRGDRFMETMLANAFNIMWLALDLPEEAERVLNEHTWVALDSLAAPSARPAIDRIQMLAQRARAELALYRGDVAALLGLWSTFDEIERSSVLNAMAGRASHCWIRGRMALALLEADIEPSRFAAEARRYSKRLAEEGVAYIDVWQKLLAAGLLAFQGDAAEACAQLREVISLAEEQEMMLCRAAAAQRLGELVGGEEGKALRDDAARWMAAQSIQSPARMIRAVAPGFSGKSLSYS